MSCKSTKTVSRSWAIARITKVEALAKAKNYRELERHVSETMESLPLFVDGHKALDVANLENWTDSMLGDKLDEPFFRESFFDNYLVSDDEGEDACS